MAITITGTTANGITVSREFTELELELIASSSPVFKRAICQLLEAVKEYEAKEKME